MKIGKSTYTAALLAALSFSCASDVEPPHGSPPAVERRPLATSPAPAPAHVPEAREEADPVVRFGSLVPEGSFAWVQAESLDAFADVGDEILSVAASASDSMSVEDLLRFFPVDGVIENVDRSRPLGLAIGFEEGTTTPASTLVLPALDRGALVQALRGMPGEPQVFGIDTYVVATMLPAYEPGAGAPALTEDLPAGEVVARIDVAAFVAGTGEMVELALGQWESASGGEMHAGLIAALAEAVSSAQSLDLALELVGGELDVSVALRATKGSALDGLLPQSSTELSELSHLVGEGDTISLLANVDGETSRELVPLWTGAIEAAGATEGHYDLASGWFEDLAEVWPLMGDAVVVTGAARAEGLQLSYFFEPTDREAFVEGLTAAFGALDEITPGLRVEGPKVRPDGTTRFWFAPEEAAEGVNLDELMRREEDLVRLFGTARVPVRLAERDGATVLAVGGGKEWLAESIARLERGGGEGPATLDDVIDRLGGANPAFVAQLDFVALAREFLTVFAENADVQIPAHVRPLPVTYYGGVAGLEWRLGFRTDFSRFGDLLRQARESD